MPIGAWFTKTKCSKNCVSAKDSKVFIKQVRRDGKIDLVLQQGSKQELDKHAHIILIKLQTGWRL